MFFFQYNKINFHIAGKKREAYLTVVQYQSMEVNYLPYLELVPQPQQKKIFW
jgi:hypothetical protein